MKVTKWHRRWELPRVPCTHPVHAQDLSMNKEYQELMFSSRFMKLGFKQWLTGREEGYLWDFSSSEGKNMTESEMTEKWECWMMANIIWGTGERELLASLLQRTCQCNSYWSLGLSSFLVEKSGFWDSRYKMKTSQFLEHQWHHLPSVSSFQFSPANLFLSGLVQNLAEQAVFQQASFWKLNWSDDLRFER